MTERAIIPIYTSHGDARAFLVYPYLYNRQGEWIGWVTAEREVYSVIGNYVGYLTPDPRILRKRAIEESKARKQPPTLPPRLRMPATVPLSRMMSELGYETIDVLDDEPELLHTLDSGDLKQDLD